MAQVISPFSIIGGAERLVLALHGYALQRGWQSAILTPRQAPRALRKSRFSIVHAHLLRAALCIAVTPGKTSLAVLTHHYADYYVQNHRRFHAGLDSWSISKVDQVVAVSNHCAQYVERFNSRCAHIPNGWSGKLGTARGGRSIVCVSHLRPEKGVDVLLRAYAVLPSSNRPGLLIAGSGSEAAPLRRLSRELGLAQDVSFLGFVDNPMQALANAAILVQPSKMEAQGLSVLEGMAAGLPVVASRVGGLPELVQPGVTGELFTAGNHEELAAHLKRLLADPGLCQRMGAAGREVAQAYTMEKTVQQYYDLYEKLLADRSAAN